MKAINVQKRAGVTETLTTPCALIGQESKKLSYAEICQRASTNEPAPPADQASSEAEQNPAYPGHTPEPALLSR